MTQKITWRGFTPKVVNQNKSHSRGVSGISHVRRDDINRENAFCNNGLTAHGFTLIELLVVVLIIAILAAVALAQYNKAVKKAQGREVLVALNALEKEIASYYLEKEYMPTEFEPRNTGVDVPILKHWKYGTSQTGQCIPSQNAPSRSSGHIHLGLGNYLDICLNGHVTDLYVRTNWEKGRLKSAVCRGSLNYPTCADYFNGCPPVQKLEGLRCGEKITYYSSQCTLK